MEFLLSAVALTIAAAALYASTLKRAEIGIGPLGHETAELTAQSWTLPEPKEMGISMPVFAYNAGARGGLLRNDLSAELKTKTVKFFLGRPAVSVLPSSRGLPHPMESGQIDLLGMNIPIKFESRSADSIGRTKELADECGPCPPGRSSSATPMSGGHLSSLGGAANPLSRYGRFRERSRPKRFMRRLCPN